jgi:hypothetical protein
LSNAHDLGDNKGRFECILTGGALHYYTLHSTCIVCPAGRVKAAAGTFLLESRPRPANTWKCRGY